VIGLVRTNGRPTLTPCSTPRYHRDQAAVVRHRNDDVELAGMARALRARMKTVSGAYGPLADAFGARRRHRGGDDRASFRAEQPAPGRRCGLSRRRRRGPGSPCRSARRQVGDAYVSSTDSKVTASDACAATNGSHQHGAQPSLASIMRTGGATPPAQPAPAASGVPGIRHGQRERFLVDRRGDHTSGLAVLHQPHRALGSPAPRPGRRASTRPTGAAIRSAGSPRPGAPARSRVASASCPGIDPRHRQQAADDAAVRRMTARSPTTNAPPASPPEQPGNDLRPDAAGVAHGDRQGLRRAGAMHHCRRGDRRIIGQLYDACAKPACSRRPTVAVALPLSSRR
jgi:hypothetical protein